MAEASARRVSPGLSVTALSESSPFLSFLILALLVTFASECVESLTSFL